MLDPDIGRGALYLVISIIYSRRHHRRWARWTLAGCAFGVAMTYLTQIEHQSIPIQERGPPAAYMLA